MIKKPNVNKLIRQSSYFTIKSDQHWMLNQACRGCMDDESWWIMLSIFTFKPWAILLVLRPAPYPPLDECLPYLLSMYHYKKLQACTAWQCRRNTMSVNRLGALRRECLWAVCLSFYELARRTVLHVVLTELPAFQACLHGNLKSVSTASGMF